MIYLYLEGQLSAVQHSLHEGVRGCLEVCFCPLPGPQELLKDLRQYALVLVLLDEGVPTGRSQDFLFWELLCSAVRLFSEHSLAMTLFQRVHLMC